jgi:uncharacterized surface protein with fasciclin (FAS1) repeats
VSLNELFANCRPGLQRANGEKAMDTKVLYQTLGLVRRTKALDAQGVFALVHPVAACCSNGIAIGFLVSAKNFSELADGDRVTVRGRLRPASVKPELPKNRVARLSVGLLRTHVEIAATSIERYDALKDKTRLDLVDSLKGEAHATFSRALRATGWDKILRQPSYFTVFAPTEYAFGRLSKLEREALFAEKNRDRLIAIVKRHVIAARRTKRDLMSIRKIQTVGGEVAVEVQNGKLFVAGARVLFEANAPRNGVVLSVDRLLDAPPAARRK